MVASAAGVADFPTGERNFGFTPFRGKSPQNLFNCIAPGDAKPNNAKPSFTKCQIRVATSLLEPTSDQAFLAIVLNPSGRVVPANTAPVTAGAHGRVTTTTGREGTAANAGTAAPDANAPTAFVHVPSSGSQSKSGIDKLGDAVFSVPGLLFVAIWIVLGVALFRRLRMRARRPAH